MDWTTILFFAGLSFGALLVWVIINYLFLEKDWGDKITITLVVFVLLGNLVLLSWELILEGYLIVVPGLFIIGFMLVAQIWLLQPTPEKELSE
ncbi:MAG: hypothetical protein ACTSYA_11010 [Candidatus Kariarchaeaceae archaeon]